MPKYPSIFISYRIADSLTQAGRLHQSLAAEFGKDMVFYDKSTLQPGMKWPTELEEKVRRARVVLVLYRNGKDWLGVDDFGARRMDDPADWVRREVETALDDPNKIVIPVLLNDAKLPPEERLPDPLKTLGYCQHKQIREACWDDDLLPLLKVLEQHVQAAPLEPAEKKPEADKSWEGFFEKNSLKNISGPWMTVNCNRREHYTEGVFSDFLKNKKPPKNLTFLLSACLHQKPASLAKRLVYELADKGVSIAHFRDAKDGAAVVVAELKIGLEAENSWADFWKTVQEKLQSLVPIPDPVALAQSDLCAGKDRIALIFRVTEKQWDNPNIEEHIAFILSMFDNLPEASRKYLLFFAFEFKHAHLPARLHTCGKYLEKLDALAKMINEGSTGLFVAHYKLFPPVAPVHIENWFDDVAVSSNINSNRVLLDTLRNQLHPDDRDRPDFDMEIVEEMQKAAYTYLNRPQSDLF